MPYRIDIDGIHKNLFLLNNLSFSSKNFCEKYLIHRENETESEYNWQYYLGWLKFVVSDILIDSSIKFRTMQDIIHSEDEEYNFDRMNDIIFKDLSICETNNIQGGIRGICNKIIHANEITLVWEEVHLNVNSNNGKQYEYWNGDINLDGRHRNQKWEIILHISEYCLAMERAITLLEDTIDWHHLYKYDE